jgi:Domain of unknown function (DUF6456)
MSAKKNGGTPEPSAVNSAASKPVVNADESPLSWLARRKDKEGRPLISKPEFDAGERLRADFYFSQMAPRVTGNWTGVSIDKTTRRGAPGFGVDMADGILAARERVRLALRAAGPELSGILIDVCCYLKGLETLEKASGWPQRSGKIVLQIALARLARHYGLVRDDEGRAGTHAVRVNHWGALNYKPRIEPDQP